MSKLATAVIRGGELMSMSGNIGSFITYLYNYMCN